MKSRRSVTKLSLANFCCLIVALAFAKLSFAVFIMQGGEIPSLSPEKKELSPRAAMILNTHQQKQKTASVEQGIKKQNIVESSNNLEQKTVVEQNITGSMENRVLHPGTKISFLPKSKEAPILKDEVVVAEKASVKNVTEAKKSTAKEAESENNSDLQIAKASAMAISQNNTSQRQSALYNNYEESNELQVLPENEVLEQEHGNYKVEKEKSSSGLSSIFGVSVAHAAEDYARPDQQTNVVVPPPSINPYISPDSLKYREAELARKEEELLTLQQQMNSRMDELNQLEGRIGDMVNNANVLQDDKFKHLISTYENMKARNAAQALATLDEKIAVQILNGMKSQQAGEIFSYMEPMHAARLSEALAKLDL